MNREIHLHNEPAIPHDESNALASQLNGTP